MHRLGSSKRFNHKIRPLGWPRGSQGIMKSIHLTTNILFDTTLISLDFFILYYHLWWSGWLVRISLLCASTCTPHSVLTQKTVRPYGYSNTAHTTSANKFWRTFPQFLSKISSYICEVHHHFASEIEQVLVTNWSLSRSTWTTYTIVT